MTLRRLVNFEQRSSSEVGIEINMPAGHNNNKGSESVSDTGGGRGDNGDKSWKKAFSDWASGTPFRLQGTVILHIWWKVLIIVTYTIAIVSLDIVVPMDFTPALVPILGVVTGFLLVFRTNTAYDRYYEGRKIWSQMTHNVRVITRCVWIAVKGTDPLIILEKKSIINFAVAFPIAVKHYLREEYSYDYEDLRGLIGQLKVAKYKANFPPGTSKDKNHGSPPLTNSGSRRATRKFTFLCPAEQPLTNIPLEILYCIGIFVNSLLERKICDPSVVRTLNFALNGLCDNLGGFERILTTPIPLAYSIHLHHALWIHLLSLPFQLVSSLKWWTIPAVGFTSFTLLGILAIGWEIENPFGHDYNDLPLDNFCESLRKEVDEIMASKLPTFDDLFHCEVPIYVTQQLMNGAAAESLDPDLDEVQIFTKGSENGGINHGFVSGTGLSCTPAATAAATSAATKL